MNDLSIQGVTDLESYSIGFENGVNYDQLNIVERLSKKICDTHYESGCEHPACYAITDLIATIASMDQLWLNLDGA